MVLPDIKNPDEILRLCYHEANLSDCKKLRFGVVVVGKSPLPQSLDPQERIIYTGCNKVAGPIAHLCEGDCIRNEIPSRTQSMVGACTHAEEKALWSLLKWGYADSLKEARMYVAGVRPDGSPLEKQVKEFTCLRCAVAMFHAEIPGIHIPFESNWHFIDTHAACEQAARYAVGAKKGWV